MHPGDWRMIVIVVMMAAGMTVHILLFMKNRTLSQRLKRLTGPADHDELSNLPNRLSFERRLESALLHKDRMTAIMYIDLDRFKNINESLGHAVGDRMIREAASRLKEAIGPFGTLTRYRGDEFAVLIQDCAGAEEALVLSKTVMQSFRRPFLGAHNIQTTVSVGIAVFPEDGTDAAEIMKHANAALNRAKEMGGNRYLFFSAEMKRKIINRSEMETNLWTALEREEFELHFQPQVEPASGRIVGAEALVRWRKPCGQMIAPGQFIPLSEETGFIVHLGEWVLRRSCEQGIKRERAGHKPIKIAVNVSPRQLQQHDYISRVQGILAETGFNPNRLVLEITEGVAIEEASTIAKLAELKKLGIQLSMDDFGTGYASLGYLQTFRVDSLKIAQSFTKDIAKKPEHARVVKAIMAVADILSLDVTVEGVETDEQLAFFKDSDNCLIQGYYYYKPMPMGDLMGIEMAG